LAGWHAVFKREFGGYFATPVALVFIVIFLVLAGVFTFELGGFFQRGQADLRPFFDFHPWLYLFLVPAVAMRLWAEERRTGTMELLLTLPISPFGAVLGKFLAAWAFVGEPDNGAIFAGYVGSLLMAGGFLAIGSAMSASTKSQVVAFILTIVVCLVLLLAGLSPVVNFIKGWLPAGIVEAITGLSFLTRFENISRGVIELRDLLYFASLMVVCLLITTWVLGAKKQ
jgi:ABC-2 type transport system permease protein